MQFNFAINHDSFKGNEVKRWFIGKMTHNERPCGKTLFAVWVRDSLLPHFSTVNFHREAGNIRLDENGENYIVEFDRPKGQLICPVRNCLVGLQECSGVNLPSFDEVKDKGVKFQHRLPERGTACLALSTENPYLADSFYLWDDKRLRHVRQGIRFFSWCFAEEWRFFNPDDGQETFSFTDRENGILLNEIPEIGMPLMVLNTGSRPIYIGVREVGETEILPNETKEICKETLGAD